MSWETVETILFVVGLVAVVYFSAFCHELGHPVLGKRNEYLVNCKSSGYPLSHKLAEDEVMTLLAKGDGGPEVCGLVLVIGWCISGWIGSQTFSNKGYPISIGAYLWGGFLGPIQLMLATIAQDKNTPIVQSQVPLLDEQIKLQQFLLAVRRDMDSGTPIQMVYNKLIQAGISEDTALRAIIAAANKPIKKCPKCGLKFRSTVLVCTLCQEVLVIDEVG